MSHSTNTLMTHMDKTLAEVKKRMEVQKEAEERERLTKIQVMFAMLLFLLRTSAHLSFLCSFRL